MRARDLIVWPFLAALFMGAAVGAFGLGALIYFLIYTMGMT